MKKILLICVAILMSANLAFAACDDGRVPCSHKCPNGTRPACKDSKGSDGKPHCVTPGYCRDAAPGAVANCDAGWTTSAVKCSKKMRKRGCKDARGRVSGYCIRY